jgi:GntR family transcriptional regulator
MAGIRNNAEHARSVLRDAISSGVFPHGSTLPSTRHLAAEFGINRNTATRIYHELADDNLVELIPNRPPIVIGGGRAPASGTLRERARKSLSPLLLESRLVGLSAADTRRMLNEITDEFFASYRPRTIYLAECNHEEARAYAQELTMKLGSIVQPVLLDELAGRASADIIITPYFHLQEARELLGEDAANLVGLVVTADSTDIARVASLVSAGPLGVVAVKMHASERLQRLLGFQIEVPMIPASIWDPETVDALAGQVECVACTLRAYSETRSRLPDVPIVLVQYHADEQSIELLRREIQRIGETDARSAVLSEQSASVASASE